MRKYLIPLLLAGALVPVAAQAKDDDPVGVRDKAARSSQRESRTEARSERSRSVQGEEPNSKVDRPARVERAPRTERSADGDRPNRAEPVQRVERPTRADRIGRVDRDVPPVQQVEAPDLSQPTQPSQSSETRRADHDGERDRYDNRHWSHDWRKDDRYDWKRHRHHHSALYRLGRFYDPYGWNYRRWSIGFSLWPSYYGSNYWLNDPWMYRLPPVYGPYRWIRYYDDALLVNIYTGEVVDVIYNFFW